jgi:hypothetical protein
MAIYIYQGMYEDLMVSGGTVVWPSAGASGNFSLALVQDHASLDTTSGLNSRQITTWGAMDSQSAITEVPTVATNYTRFALNVLARGYSWDPNENNGELQLTYDNVNYPVVWSNLTSGYIVGAYVLLRTVDGGANDKVWMADSGATGLPASTNGEDFRITINNEAIVKAYQKP